jgi:hypothetical protein
MLDEKTSRGWACPALSRDAQRARHASPLRDVLALYRKGVIHRALLADFITKAT